MSDLNWNLRDILHQFSDSRLHVFMSIYLHKNIRNRSWPGHELICEETGLSTAPVTKAIDWLIQSQTVVLVPYEKRVGLELKLPSRKYVYQLTGVVLVGEEYHPYMNLTPEGWQSIATDLELMGNVLLSKTLNDANSLLSKSLLSKSKGIKENSREDSKRESVRKRNTTTALIHPFIAAWAEVRGIDTVNIGAPVFSAKDTACAKRMAKWDIPPHYDEIRGAIQSSKSTTYAFQWLEADIPKARLAKPAESIQSTTPTEDEMKLRSPARKTDSDFERWLSEQQEGTPT